MPPIGPVTEAGAHADRLRSHPPNLPVLSRPCRCLRHPAVGVGALPRASCRCRLSGLPSGPEPAPAPEQRRCRTLPSGRAR